MSTNNLSPVVQGALEVLNREFGELLRRAGCVMRSLCHSDSLTGEWSDDDDRGAELYLEWSDRFPATASHYRDLLRQSTPSAQFWARLYFCLEVVAALAVRRNDADRKRWVEAEDGDFEIAITASVTIFDHLVQIGIRVVPDAVAWAKAQMEGMVQRHRAMVHEHWALESMDEANTVKALSRYERILRERIEIAAGDAYKKATKHLKPVVTTSDAKASPPIIERKLNEKPLPEQQQGGADRKKQAREEREHIMKLLRDEDVSIELRAAVAIERHPGAVRRLIRGGKLVHGGAPGTCKAGPLQDYLLERFPLEKDHLEKIRRKAEAAP